MTTAGIRLVRCPKCREVLPELPNVPLYMCGGCGVVLQAKNRKNGKSVNSGSLEMSTSQKNQLEHGSEDVKSISSVQVEKNCDKKECSPDLNAKEQVESAECSIEPSGESRNFLNVISSGESKEYSSGLSAKQKLENQLEHDSEDVKSISSVQMENYFDKKICLPDLNAKEQVESADCNIEASGRSGNFLSGVSFVESEECSSDLSAKEQLENQFEHDSEDVKKNSSVQMENYSDLKECSPDLNTKEQVESADCSIEPSGESRNFLNGVSSGESEEWSSDLIVKEQLENQVEHDSEHVKPTSSVQMGNYCDRKECSPDLNVKEQVETADCNIEPSGGSRNLNGVSSGESEECPSDLIVKEQLDNQVELDSKDVKPTSSVQMESYCDKKECSPDLNAKEQVESADCSIEPSGGSRNFLNGVSSGESEECSSDLMAKEQLENQFEHGSEDVKPTCSVQVENYSDKKECSPDLNAKEQVESADCSIDPSGGSRNFLNGVSSGELGECSSDLNVKEQLENQFEYDSEDVKSTSSVQMENYCDKKECLPDLYAMEQVEYADCSIEPSGGSTNFLNGFSSGDSEECSSDLSAKEQIDSTDCSIEPSGSRNFLNEFSSGDSLIFDNGKEQIESGDCTIKRSESRSFSKEVPSSDFRYEREEKSSKARRKTRTDENDESRSTDSQLSSLGKSSSFIAQRQSDESNPVEMNFTSLNKQLQQSQKISHSESDHTKPVETVEALGTIDNGNISEELSVTPGDISKSPTARSSHAYYDGSVSSFDEWDDHVPEQPSYLPKRSWFKHQVVAGSPSNKERPRREDWLTNKKIGNNSEVQHQARKLLSMPSGQKHGLAVMERLKWEKFRIQAQGQVGSSESDGLHPIKNSMISERERFWARESSQRGIPTVYENGSPLNHGNEELLCCTNACSSSKVDYFEQMELLRKVDELRDQLSRSYNQIGMPNARFSARSTQQEKQKQLCYSYEQLDSKGPHCYDANYHRHPSAPYWPRKNGCQQCGFSQNGCQNCEFSEMIFSGQGTNCRNHVGYSCYHCFPEGGQRMTQLPSSSSCCNNGLFGDHSAHMCYKPYGSSSATPQKHINSSLRGHQMYSQDQAFMDHDGQKKYHQDRHQPTKRHCRPLAGGAPFIICYRCYALLQLPEDFILQKKIHQLQCSACSQILKFSLQNRTHIVPYNQTSVEPSPSEVDNSSNSTTGRDFVYVSHALDYPQGELVSYSEDCGPSIRKSCSTESDRPYPILQGNADDKEQPSGSYSEAKVEGKSKSEFKQSGNKHKTSMEASESTSASSYAVKVKSSSLEGEVVPRLSSSPLHQLMGYSSPSEIINES
ncbi:hypothetical protein NE237_009991 [Protea cynaroides]|uniref:Zinc-ribbon domain-containing protein n=1 Tax=Protea cynaroides TaxID=273540 RepID=A0A9Q0KYW2_9MAGN|nr:hypothetical protein NE237_009991 [Protea cynaroides]